MIAGIVATISQALGITIDKVILSQKRVPQSKFIPILFLFLALFSLPVAFWLGAIDFNALFTFKYIALYLLMIIVAFAWNILYYWGIGAEKVNEFELILMFNPLIVVLLASLFFKGERNFQIILAAFIASLALVGAHLKREHIRFSKASVGLIFCVILMSVETIIHRYLLDIISPASLYFTRTLILFIIFALFYRPKISGIKFESWGLIALTGIEGVIQFVARFYGYRDAGVIITTLVLTLAPILVYFAAYIYFKEQIKKRMIVAGLIILACIIWATIAHGG
ncbi:MAG: DMT family transporter [Candidatus Berkelbacteria bacterium]|nr:DMT family transporter [Candidatus Berkelbacteria bacterium]